MEIRKIREDDKNKFLRQRNLNMGTDKKEELWIWEYFNSPWGPTETWIAVDGNLIVGQYSMQKYEAIYFGKKIMASLAFDAGTHPEYRRKGIFVALGKKILSEMRKQRILFSNGFPNKYAISGHLKVNWHQLFLVPWLSHNNLNEIRIEKNSNYRVEQIKKFGLEFKGFSENFKDQIPIYLNRTLEYLNWRFVEKPGIEYLKYQILDKTGELVAYFVIKFFSTTKEVNIDLMDFLLPNDIEIYKAMLSFIVNTAKNQEVKRLSLILNKHHPLNQFLSKYGFGYDYNNRFYIIHNNSYELNEKDLLKESNHFITMTNSDVF